MIFLNSILDVIDNSGVLKFKYIKNLNKGKSVKYGDILIGVVYKVNNNNVLYKKSDICKGILVQQKAFLNLKKYYSIKFSKNAVIVLNNNLVSIGTKSNFYISKYIKNKLNIDIKKLKGKFI